ncbi:Aryl-phospho-beta-D-glucosidase BglC, GH1 family [Fibrobacter sp. UWT2]|uniref:glycoside hydrolase family 5 protein n=1 Tax=Fibrobacter sp. UWT2 TaxID=1896224 RepID=UPI00091E4D89|nr:glycoside hydrolase family 5 protein [Fibrobacter sp. UWT2]SHK48924.1 Aryl-phospho-beta-D-glucosidase BglC, GH1 family [Fibrobacter sp. UWT2]
MKKKFLGARLLASTAALILLASCSDDGSSGSTNGAEVLPDQSTEAPVSPENTENPVIEGSEEGSSSEVLTPEEVANEPITEEDLKDDGTASVTTLTVGVSGVAEIGPFAEGATVSLSGVDVKTMTLSGSALSGKVSSNLGAFTVSGDISSAVASIEVKGDYVNFTSEERYVASGIKALSDLRERNKVNVNVLTRLEYDRVQYLVTEMGLSFTAAKTRAEKEVLAALGLKQDSTLFEDISLYDHTQAAANLLAVTAALLEERSAGDVDAALSAIAADIAPDGTWDDPALKASVGDIAYSLNTGYPSSVLSDLNGGASIEYFSVWVEHIWAAQYGLGSCGASNQNQVKPNANAASVNASMQFVCQDTLWSMATEAILLNLAAAALFGECSDANVGQMKANDEGKYFVCRKNAWKVAGDEDLANMKVAEQNGACTSANEGTLASYESDYYVCVSNFWSKTKNVPVDYSKGRAMNKRLGRGINMGNAWESTGNGATADCGWNNCIQDGYFKIVKDAGFNSVRIPVRWNQDASNSSPYSLDAGRLSGVKADIDLALAQGLAVIVNFHHYTTLNDAAAGYTSNKSKYESEKARFLGMWEQVAKEMNAYPDSLLVLEIFNEPHDMKVEQVNDIMNSAYEVIRKNAPGKTIMFEAGAYSKFGQIPKLTLPADGNIIVSGHYYEPYTFTHQGHGYDCNNSLSDKTVASIDGEFKGYADAIAEYFPDIKGGSVPMNMGEFGVSGQHGSSCGGNGVSDDLRAKWTDAAIAAAEKYGMSWHYWGFVGVGGFEAYDKGAGQWYSELLQVFTKYTSK